MQRKKIVYIISDIQKSLEFEWLVEDWDHDAYELSFVLINGKGSQLESYIDKHGIPVDVVRYKGKSMIFSSIFLVIKSLRKVRPGIVHCHLLNAGIIGMIASWLCRVPRRIYTRHHGSFHHDYHPSGVIFDRLINMLATDIVAISKNVKQILIERDSAQPSKLRLIHHGFKLKQFEDTSVKRVNRLMEKYNPSHKWPVIGVISRFFELKGIQYVIPAFANLLRYFPDALLVMANARGPYDRVLQVELEKIERSQYKLIEFEDDIFSLFKLFTCHVHVPVNTSVEAFGQTYIEALASGVPAVFTLSGVGHEILQHETNCLVVGHRDSDAILEAILRLLEDRNLRDKIIRSGKVDVQEFEFTNMMKSLYSLYE